MITDTQTQEIADNLERAVVKHLEWRNPFDGIVEFVIRMQTK